MVKGQWPILTEHSMRRYNVRATVGGSSIGFGACAEDSCPDARLRMRGAVPDAQGIDGLDRQPGGYRLASRGELWGPTREAKSSLRRRLFRSARGTLSEDGRAGHMGKRSAVVELFLGDMGSIQRELRPSTQ